MLVENSIAAANGELAIPAWIPGETDTRRWIKQVSGGTAGRDSGSAALNDAVERVAVHRAVRVESGRSGHVLCGIEVERDFVFLVDGAVETDTKPEIQG